MRRLIPTLALALGAAAPALAQQGTGNTFNWSGDVQQGRWLYVRNLNGPVRVERGTGNKVEVTGEKRWRRGDPEVVHFKVEQVGPGKGDVMICALWYDNSDCDEGGYHSHSDGWRHHDDNDVSVEFTVRLPAGVKMDASTVNGGVSVDGATAEVVARTVNGSVEARSVGGPVSARTVNGDVDVETGALGSGRLDYSTTNGSITVQLPAAANADVDMRTVNGSISSDFPLMVQGTIDRRHLRATLGKGGPELQLRTVNGSIRLRKS